MAMARRYITSNPFNQQMRNKYKLERLLNFEKVVLADGKESASENLHVGI
jgi:hypothetical protein